MQSDRKISVFFEGLGLWGIVGLASMPVLIYFRNPGFALLVGCFCTLMAGQKAYSWSSKVSKLALQTAIVLLGFTLNAKALWEISAEYSGLVTGYVLLTIAFGLVLGRLLFVDGTSNRLITSGTAICGGTAVASLSPLLRANAHQTGTVLALIFILNILALFTFPTMGHWLELDQTTFGLWCALAIHDTASVVATAAVYGEEAAEIATTVKLGRMLWLIPLMLVFSLTEKQPSTKLAVPPFILLFIAASILGSLWSATSFAPPPELFEGAKWVSKTLLVIALFLIGSEINRETLKQVKAKTLAQMLLLWAIVVPVSLIAIQHWG